MLPNRHTLPSIAHRASANTSKYPELWRGLVGAWCPSLGVTGAKLLDMSGLGNDGTLTNMDPGTDWVTSGQGGYALDFDGTGLINVGDVDALEFAGSQPITWSFWLKSTAATSQRVIAKYELSNGFGQYLISYFGQPANKIISVTLVTDFFSRGRISRNSSLGSVSLNQWFHIAAVWDGSFHHTGISIYVDGNEVGYSVGLTTGTFTGFGSSTRPTLFGCANLSNDTNYTGHMTGNLDDVRIYNRALSPDEIWTLSGFGGNEEVGRGIAYQRRDLVLPYTLAAAAAGRIAPRLAGYGGMAGYGGLAGIGGGMSG